MFKAIPKTVRLPGFKVKIEQIEHEDFIDDFGGRTKAAWVDEERVIYLDRSRPIRKRRADLAHELGHVIMDYQALVLGSKYADAKG